MIGLDGPFLLLSSRVVGVRLIPVLITDYTTSDIATPAEAARSFARIRDATDTLAQGA